MAMRARTYTSACAMFANGAVDWATTDVRCLLLKSTYTYSAAHQYVSDVISGSIEISASGYSRQTLGSFVAPTAANPSVCDSTADITFSSLASGQTIGFVVFYKYNAADASAEVLFCMDEDTPTTYPTNGGNFVVALNASGLFTVSA